MKPSDLKAFGDYVGSIQASLAAGHASEGSHYPALKSLLEGLGENITATSLPSRIECGAPDFVLTKGSATVGYIEAKDIGKSLDEVERTEQLKRYRDSLANLILTDYLEFHWYVDGERRLSSRLGTLAKDGKIRRDKAGIEAVAELLTSFLSHRAEAVGTSRELALRMASLAHMIRDLIVAAFEKEPESGTLHAQFSAFRDNLIPSLLAEQFADMYAQTIAYGLFAARCTNSGSTGFTRQNAAYLLPKTNPFLRKLFNRIAGPDLDDRIAWLVDDLAEVLAQADMASILQDFGRRSAKEDPVVHFYETFLAVYDPTTRVKRGIYYTPEPVVSYIVRSIDQILKTRFGKLQGLADPDTRILDPAVGTATFLYTVVRYVYNVAVGQGQRGLWNDYVSEKLLPRIFGFELLMAPYTVAHLKLGLLLQETGYKFGSNQRLGIYLTNTLEEAFKQSELLAGFNEYIVDEANAAAEIKKDTPIMVVLGNPPYAKQSANRGKWIDGLLKGRLPSGEQVPGYYEVDGKPLGERNPKWLQNDYVKFIRFGQWRIERTGQGILGFITGHGYLDNPTFRGMRQQLISAFNQIYVLDLHGNVKKRESPPGGGKDENVFDIQEGVAIGIFIKEADKTEPARVYHADLWGLREHKYQLLSEKDILDIEWSELTPRPPFYLFIPQEAELFDEYSNCWSVAEIFGVFASTVTTARNDFTMAHDPQSLVARVGQLQDESVDDQTLRETYNLRDVSYWNLRTAREQLRKVKDIGQRIRAYCYRPFDFRFVFYHEAICERPRREVMRHMNKSNLAFLTHRPQSPGDFTFAYCTRMIGDQCVAANKSAGGGNSFQFPLYLYMACEDEEDQQRQLVDTTPWPSSESGRVPNLNTLFVADLETKLCLQFVTDGCGDLESTFGPEDIFHYVYAVLYSPTFRSRYAEPLKADFPRLPLTSDVDLFRALCTRGAQLVALHLMESPALNKLITQYPIPGSNEVEKVTYSELDQRVHINKSQYFQGIQPEVWSFEIGSYQICQKWLKDRKGKTLSFDDLMHYQKIVVALKETIRLTEEIDALVPSWPLE